MKKILIILAGLILILVNKDNSSMIIIPDSSIRFRVLANSNSIEDINIKNNISSYLDEKLINMIKESKDVDEATDELLNNKTKIMSFIDEYLLNNKINIEYDLSIGENYFPTKYYKGVKYEAGYYDSVVLKLGSASGMNWWCVIYPPLCLIDEEHKDDIEYTSLVKETIDKYRHKL